MELLLLVKNLDKAEESARKILEHVEAIREIQMEAKYGDIRIDVEGEIKENTASGN